MTLTLNNGYQGAYEGSLEFPKAYGYGARIGALWVRLAASPEVAVNIYSQDSLATRQADQSNVYEQVLDIGNSFSRSNLTGGEGLDFFPRADPQLQIELDATRYFSSSGVSMGTPPPGEPYRLRLAPLFESWYDPINTVTGIASSTTRLFVAAGDSVYQFDNLLNATPDNTQQLEAGQDITQIRADQANNAVALLDNGNVWFKPRGTSTWTVVTGSPAMDNIVGVWMAKDRIIAAKQDPANLASGVELGELALGMTGAYATPSFSPAFTSIDTFFGDVMTVIDAGTAILAATTDGYLRSYVPQTDNAGGVPVLTVRAKSQLPSGEYAYTLAHNAGRVIVLTDELGPGSITNIRAYAAELLDARFDFVVGNFSLIREWENVDGTPSINDSMVTDREDIWWLINETDGDTYLWRYDLATTGVFRESVVSTGEFVHLTKYYDRLLCSDGGAVWKPDSQHQSMGWLITPNVTFGLNTDISWMATILEAVDIGAGAKVELLLSTDPDGITDPDHASWQTISRYQAQDYQGIENNLVGIVSKTAALQIRLFPTTDGLTTPKVTRFALRGFPKHRDWILELPVNVSDMIEAPWRQPYRLAGWGDEIATSLFDLIGAHLEATVFDPPIMFRGIVDAVMDPRTYTTYRGSMGRYCIVRLRGTRTTSIETISTTHLGLGVTGIATTGL